MAAWRPLYNDVQRVFMKMLWETFIVRLDSTGLLPQPVLAESHI
jgi:hypothetical protein